MGCWVEMVTNSYVKITFTTFKKIITPKTNTIKKNRTHKKQELEKTMARRTSLLTYFWNQIIVDLFNLSIILYSNFECHYQVLSRQTCKLLH